MSATNKMFAETNPINSQGSITGSMTNFDRPNLLTQQVANELNTYRNWGSFRLVMPPVGDTKDSEGKEQADKFYNTGATPDAVGIKSLFNNVNAVPQGEGLRLANNAPLLDTPENRKKQRLKSVCTVKELVRASETGEMGRAIYNYSDFMYCKQLGKIPNNYLITLRRFPNPCGDHINFTIPQEAPLNQHAPDIGRMVTWLGVNGNDMSSILKYSVKMPWKELKSEIQEKQMNEAGGALGKILNAADGTYQQQVRDGQAGAGAFSLMKPVMGGAGNMIGDAPYANAEWMRNYDKNKNYGPIDVISKTWIRKDQEGLDFTNSFTLTFDYELRSYDGINGKSAMLDLLGNILATTYTSGKFWGGSVKYYGCHQSNVFANLPIFKDGLTYANLKDRVFESYTAISKEFGGEGVLDTIKKVAKAAFKGFAGALLGGAINKLGRPQRDALHSQLSSAPTGMWHVMIGNPKNPIMCMGNMIVDNTEIEHYGPLGLDDFPTGLRVKVTMKHGKPRDTTAIEQMYFMGDNRIYSPMGSRIQSIYNAATNIKKPTKVLNTESADKTANAATTLNGEDISPIKSEASYKYMKFFGTTSTQAITLAAQEAMFGSTPAKKGKGK